MLLTCWRFLVSCMLKRLDTQEGRREVEISLPLWAVRSREYSRALKKYIAYA
jgi:hypothetical protein